MATVTLTQENFEQTVSAGGIVLVDFWATWCGPCRQFGPIFEEASEKYPDIVFGKIDTDDQQQLAMAAQITSIPTLMVFRDGIVVFRQSGALPLSALEDLSYVATGHALERGRAGRRVISSRSAWLPTMNEYSPTISKPWRA